MVDVADKVAYFQAITGVEDSDLVAEILAAHNWDLEVAISSFTSPDQRSGLNLDNSDGNNIDSSFPMHNDNDFNEFVRDGELVTTNQRSGLVVNQQTQPPAGIVWKLVTLPFSIVSASLGLVSGAVGLGLWAAGGVISYGFGLVGGRGGSGSCEAPVSAAVSEAAAFVAVFEREYGVIRPGFVVEGFMDALQRSRREYKLLFVYLHSPEHSDTQGFCERTLCNEVFAGFVNENFVAWGGSIRESEGFKMSNSLKASRFPFCAVVMAATNNRVALLQQVEGPKSPEEMLAVLQRVLEESSPVLVSARLEAEERRSNIRLREEQDAAYRAALEADQARERQRKEEQERLAREAAEAERKLKEEEEARERAAQEAAEKKEALAKLREEKALALGAEPEKGPDVTQILVRFPSGERKGRRFLRTTKLQSLYDYVDSLGCLEAEGYTLFSNFPRVVYGQDKLSLSLEEAGLHPQASLFVEINS